MGHAVMSYISPNEEHLLDTCIACAARGKNVFRYVYGKDKPNYPVPTLPEDATVNLLREYKAEMITRRLYGLD